MTELTPEELITVDYWRGLASRLGPPFLYSQTEDVDGPFLSSLAPGTVLLTGFSDCGVHEQEGNHPNGDLLTTLCASYDWQGLAQVRDSYVRVQVGPCILSGHEHRCHPRHRYVVKMERTAVSTFDAVPPGLRWFTTNLNVDHPQLRWLPFGVNDEGDGKEKILFYRGRPKRGLLYVNFSPNTLHRVRLLEHFRKQPWATCRENVPVEQFFEEMAEHSYTLAPSGNGSDCYRTCESLYLGSVPILPAGTFGRHWLDTGLPVMLCSDYLRLTEAELRGNLPFFADILEHDLRPLTRSFWLENLGRMRDVLA